MGKPTAAAAAFNFDERRRLRGVQKKIALLEESGSTLHIAMCKNKNIYLKKLRKYYFLYYFD